MNNILQIGKNNGQRLLIMTGVALIAFTMCFGVYYAIFDEHQTLVGMGQQMASGFVNAAKGDLTAAYSAFDSYGVISAEYHHEVHSHGHWGMLALVLLLLGIVFRNLAFTQQTCQRLAYLLCGSAALFPLGIILQIGALELVGKLFASAGAVGLIVGLILVIFGLLRTKRLA